MKDKHEVERLIVKALKDISVYAGVKLPIRDCSLHTILERLIEETTP